MLKHGRHAASAKENGVGRRPLESLNVGGPVVEPLPTSQQGESNATSTAELESDATRLLTISTLVAGSRARLLRGILPV